MTNIGWYQFKLFVAHASGIGMDAMHILAGCILFILAAIVLRRSTASRLPWLAVFLLELGNEAYDLTVERWPDLATQLGEGAKDIILTMALPTLVMLLARWKPALLTGRADQEEGRP